LTRTSVFSTASLLRPIWRIRGPVTREYTAIHHEQHPVRTLFEEMVKMGFDRAHLLQPRGPERTRKVLTGRREMLMSALDALKNHRPQMSVPMPALTQASTSTVAPSELTVCVPGPITRVYTVINQALPRELFANKTHRMADLDKASWAFARIGFFHGVTARGLLLAGTYSRVKVLDLGLNPWALYGNIFDMKP
jgi:hypothetical protein